jgi:hypothetical protein
LRQAEFSPCTRLSKPLHSTRYPAIDKGDNFQTQQFSGYPAESKKTPQDFFFSTEDTPLLCVGFFIKEFL